MPKHIQGRATPNPANIARPAGGFSLAAAHVVTRLERCSGIALRLHPRGAARQRRNGIDPEFSERALIAHLHQIQPMSGGSWPRERSLAGHQCSLHVGPSPFSFADFFEGSRNNPDLIVKERP